MYPQANFSRLTTPNLYGSISLSGNALLEILLEIFHPAA